MEVFTPFRVNLQPSPSLRPNRRCGIFHIPPQIPIEFTQIHQDFTLIFEEQSMTLTLHIWEAKYRLWNAAMP